MNRQQPIQLWVTAMWNVPKNPKRSAEHYLKVTPATSALLRGLDCHAWVDSVQWAREFDTQFRYHGVSAEIYHRGPYRLVPRNLVRAVRHNAIARFTAGTPGPLPAGSREKDTVHLQRDLLAAGPQVYTRLVSAWLAKPFAINASSRLARLSNSDLVGWIDASFSRILPTGSHRLEQVVPESWRAHQILHLEGGMDYRNRPLGISAAILVASVATWQWLGQEFHRAALTAFQEAYLHDEETVLSEIARRNLERFFTASIDQLIEPAR